MENRYRYNGKEYHQELGLGLYDYCFRWYDPAIARFVSGDPLAEDFYYLTTYQYASNTPIQAIDLDGLEALVVTGNPDALEKFKDLSNRSGGGFINTQIDSNSGLVSISNTSKSGVPSDREQTFIDEMKSITIEGSEEFEVVIVGSNEEVTIGNFDKEAVDIDDVAQFGDDEFFSAAGTLAHELVEQKSKQVDGNTLFEDAHADGIVAENRVNGSERRRNPLPSTKLEGLGLPGIPLNGNLDIQYSKIVKGEAFPKKQNVRVLISNSNVEKVQKIK